MTLRGFALCLECQRHDDALMRPSLHAAIPGRNSDLAMHIIPHHAPAPVHRQSPVSQSARTEPNWARRTARHRGVSVLRAVHAQLALDQPWDEPNEHTLAAEDQGVPHCVARNLGAGRFAG